MNTDLTYFIARKHIDELLREAERAHRCRSASPQAAARGRIPTDPFLSPPDRDRLTTMTIVLILNVIGSVGLVVAIVGLLGLNIALGRHRSSTMSS